jgi:cytochrome c biogenesis protein CcmG/thiol:disulfide interchange protein DsbE
MNSQAVGAAPPAAESRLWRRGKWAIPLSVLPLLVLLAYGFRTDPRAIPSPLVGKTAPPFSIELFDGGRLSLADLGGKVVVLNFWASWCYPACYEEAPVLEHGWRAWKDRGVVVIGVDIQDREEPARKFLKQFSLSFPNGPDPSGKISVDYGVYGVPETFFIDKAGRIRKKHVGAVTEEVFTREVLRLLKEGT